MRLKGYLRIPLWDSSPTGDAGSLGEALLPGQVITTTLSPPKSKQGQEVVSDGQPSAFTGRAETGGSLVQKAGIGSRQFVSVPFISRSLFLGVDRE